MKKKAAGAVLVVGVIALGMSAAPASADNVRVDFGSSVVDVPVPDGLGPILNQVIPGDISGIVGSANGLLDLIGADGSSTGGGTGGGTGAGSNGVASISGSLSIYNNGFGGGRELGPNLYSLGFRPRVTWEARDWSNGKITGNKCQMEISFPGTDQATYKTSNCSGSTTSTPKYNKAGTYSIKILDRVSGKSTTKTFTVTN